MDKGFSWLASSHHFLVKVPEIALDYFPWILGLVQVFYEFLGEIDVQGRVHVALEVFVLRRGLLVDHQFEIEGLDEGLPDADIDVEKVDGAVDVGPDTLLLLVKVPVHSEVREVVREDWKEVIVAVVYKDEL